ncbi:hypothetical protein JYK00_06625 [Thermosipho ferrireducens]|uniref:Uncharacterized protein n=1 Tax=Thermosipho ferrireducens TaxID=2571116 RepID=A0ABX7S5I1_9BACT|nr:hypothetical protein [Thermosipho ferrireducens]QTA37409.1 hypothetical protein JYK00_06625 [Thermosipho ferrireducens]
MIRIEFVEKLLKGVDKELAMRFLEIKMKFEKEFSNSKLKREFVEVFWQLYDFIADNISEDSEIEKRLFLRYGLVDTKYLLKADLEKLKNIPFSEQEEDFFYVDEWLIAVKSGKVTPSSFEELRETKRVVAPLNITQIKKVYEEKLQERQTLEEKLKELVKGIESDGPYHSGILMIIQQVTDTCNALRQIDKEIHIIFNKLKDAENKLGSREFHSQNKEEVFTEPLVIKQMVKKSIGRLGNNFPALATLYLRNVQKWGTKAEVRRVVSEIESIDYTIFMRKLDRVPVRFPPYFILIPGYGDIGFCWEPFEGMNFSTGRGRVVIPMFGKNLWVSVVQALGDYRWKASKELAFGHWMEEGLTGEIYNYLVNNKIKERPDDYFIKNYILWLAKEAKGVQKLEKEIREIFWRYIEFPEELKTKLSKVSYVYSILYEKDKRRRK